MLPPTPISAVRESQTAKNRNPKTQETEAHAPLSCKIHYSITRAYPRKSDAPAFFTDDLMAAARAREQDYQWQPRDTPAHGNPGRPAVLAHHGPESLTGRRPPPPPKIDH